MASGWTRHALRRTAATLMGELGAESHVIEAALNHTIHSKLAATYHQSRCLPAAKKALQLLGDHPDGIAAGGDEVHSLDSKRLTGGPARRSFPALQRA